MGGLVHLVLGIGGNCIFKISKAFGALIFPLLGTGHLSFVVLIFLALAQTRLRNVNHVLRILQGVSDVFFLSYSLCLLWGPLSVGGW